MTWPPRVRSENLCEQNENGQMVNNYHQTSQSELAEAHQAQSSAPTRPSSPPPAANRALRSNACIFWFISLLDSFCLFSPHVLSPKDGLTSILRVKLRNDRVFMTEIGGPAGGDERLMPRFGPRSVLLSPFSPYFPAPFSIFVVSGIGDVRGLKLLIDHEYFTSGGWNIMGWLWF